MKPLQTQLVYGAAAGLAATVPMSGAMLLMHRQLPEWEQYPLPPREITEELAEKTGERQNMSEEELSAATAIAHFAYGAAAGAAYAATAQKLPVSPLVKGTAFGLAVWAGSYLGWLPALGILTPATEHPAGRNALMITAHVIWGSVTGILTDQLQR
jgi:uncharacterized membrane protein YagU involved in acid resistance